MLPAQRPPWLHTLPRPAAPRAPTPRTQQHLYLLNVEEEQQFNDLHGGQERGKEDPQPEEGVEKRGLQSRVWGPDPRAAPQAQNCPPGLAQDQTSRKAQQGDWSLGPLGAEGSGHSRIPGLDLAGALRGKGSASPGAGQWDTQGRCSPSQGLPVNQLQNISCNVELRLPLPLKLLLREKPGAEEPRGH